jgi:LEA14-like dessication related protein
MTKPINEFNWRRGLSLTTLLPALFALASCVSLHSDFDPPTVTVTSLRSVQSDSPGINFELVLKVVNPNRYPLKLAGVAYTLSLEDREVVTGVGKDLPTIDGYDEGLITLTASLSVLQTMRLMGDLVNEPRDHLRYELNTKLDLGTLHSPVRVKDAGRISLAPPN